MSIFARLKMSKKAAKEHKAKTTQQLKTEAAPKAPYRHVPTHAAVDALTGAPSSWKHEDRPKIKEHHKRRSMMALGRAASSHSTQADHPPVSLRNSSYSSYNPTWNDRGDYSYLNEPYQKRNRASRNHSYIDSGIGPSPLGSNEASDHASPATSSNSSLTDDNLEMPPQKRAQVNGNTVKDTPEPSHAGTTRKLGEAPKISPPASPVAPAVSPSPKMEKKQKKGWLLKGKGREIGVAT